jgi:parvulin-like peptidyl-prolyl isomerase
VEVKRSQIEKAFIAYSSNLAASGKRLPENQRLMREAQLLDRMIVTHLLTNRASRMDFTVAVGMSEKYYTDTKLAAGSDEAFVRQLRMTGLTPEQFNQRVLEQALAESVLDRELKSTIRVSDAEVEAFYREGTDELVRALQAQLRDAESNPQVLPGQLAAVKDRIEALKAANLSRFVTPEKVRVAHILVSTRIPKQEDALPEEQRRLKRLDAERLLRRARTGEDFMTLVREHSEDRRLAESGGEYVLARNEAYAPEFVAAAFSLEPGQISDIVTTVFGFHIIKQLERFPSERVDFEPVAPKVREFLGQQRLQLLLPEYFKKLKAEAAIEILEPRYRIELPEDDPDMGPGLNRRPAP